MKQDDQNQQRTDDLRSQAESSLHNRFPGLENVENLERTDVDRLVHELRVHQIELEIQNEELRRLQEALSESRDKYVDLYDFAPVGYFTLDRSGLIMEVNLTGVALVGTDRSHLLGKHFQGLLANEYTDTFFRFKEKAVSTRKGQRCEVQIRGAGDKPMYVQLDALVFGDDESGITGLKMIVTDISQRKTMEEALQFERDQLFSIFDNMDAIVDVVDPKTCELLYLNRCTKELLGGDRTGSLCYEVFHGYEAPCEFCTNDAVMKLQGKPYHWEYHSERFDRDFMTTNMSIRWPDGRDVKLELSFDITDRKDLEQKLLEARKMEAIGTLAIGIAHDFNNMLQVILGYADLLLLDKRPGQPGHNELQHIIKTAYEARDLVQRIRVISKDADVQKVPLDFNQHVDRVAHSLEQTLPNTITVDVHLAAELDLIHADSALMNQMVLNLGVNAGEAMPDGGTLTIRTENTLLDDDFCHSHPGLKPGPHVLLAVSDTGRGIEKNLLDKIFDPFFTTKARDYHKGTGLGLAVAKGVVELHKGAIDVESQIGMGTTFRIYLPVRDAEKDLKTVEPTSLPIGGDETVLLVEDEELVRNLGKYALEQFGYKVIAVSDGQEAIELYEKERDKISLVILDIIMPRMDGRQCLMELLRIHPAVKVLISSGVAEEHVIQSAVDLGAKGALTKPFNVRALIQKVREVLDAD